MSSRVFCAWTAEAFCPVAAKGGDNTWHFHGSLHGAHYAEQSGGQRRPHKCITSGLGSNPAGLDCASWLRSSCECQPFTACHTCLARSFCLENVGLSAACCSAQASQSLLCLYCLVKMHLKNHLVKPCVALRASFWGLAHAGYLLEAAALVVPHSFISQRKHISKALRLAVFVT